MPAQARQIILFKRKKTKGSPWSAFLRTKDGRRLERSTGETSKAAAENWCIEKLKTLDAEDAKRRPPLPGSKISKKDWTLAEYSKGFFDWDGPYVLNLKACGRRISERVALQKASIVRRLVLPRIGQLKLPEIKAAVIKNLRNNLYNEGLQGSRINQVLSCLKGILQAAEEEELIPGMPSIQRASDKARPKGILTLVEVSRLFFEYQWPDKRAKVASMLAATTGMRISEVLALKPHCLIQERREIIVATSWDSDFRRMTETTKNGRIRTLPVPVNVWSELALLIAENPHDHPDPFIFYALDREGGPRRRERPAKERPILPRHILYPLFDALKAIGVSEEERKKRNITFHSWRAFFNSSQIDAGVPIQQIQKITGHLSIEMVERYYRSEDANAVRAVQETLIAPPTLRVIPIQTLTETQSGFVTGIPF